MNIELIVLFSIVLVLYAIFSSMKFKKKVSKLEEKIKEEYHRGYSDGCKASDTITDGAFVNALTHIYICGAFGDNRKQFILVGTTVTNDTITIYADTLGEILTKGIEAHRANLVTKFDWIDLAAKRVS